MKHFLLILSLLLLPFMLFASNDDLYKSKGTTQDVIVHLSPSPSQEDVSRNVKIEVTFNVSLDAPAIKEYDVKLTYLSSKTNEHIAVTISYSETDKKLTFTPKASLEPGMYEVEIESLKVDKAHKEIKIDAIMYRFVVVNEVLQSMTIHPDAIELKEGKNLPLEVVGYYDTGVEKDITTQVQWSTSDSQIVTVDANATLKALKEGTTTVTVKMESIETNMTIVVYKEINDHRLPTEPDPTLNDSTLLGIDSNGNGVRDDVERYIYERFGKDPEYPKTKTEIAMQYAKAYQFIMANDPQNSFENKSYKKMDYALDCKWYWYRMIPKELNISSIEQSIKRRKFRLKNKIYDDIYKEKLFNTKLRMKAYFYYNSSLSGHVLSGGGGILSSTKDKCDFDIDSLDEIE